MSKFSEDLHKVRAIHQAFLLILSPIEGVNINRLGKYRRTGMDNFIKGVVIDHDTENVFEIHGLLTAIPFYKPGTRIVDTSMLKERIEEIDTTLTAIETFDESGDSAALKAIIAEIKALAVKRDEVRKRFDGYSTLALSRHLDVST